MGITDLIFGIAGPLLDRLFPDPVERAKAQFDMMKLNQEGAFKELDNQFQTNLAQVEQNKIEGASDDLFKSGWRPAVGWICVCAFAYAGLVRPLMPWGMRLAGHECPDLPPIDDVFTELLFGMLGLGGMRTWEKLKR